MISYIKFCWKGTHFEFWKGPQIHGYKSSASCSRTERCCSGDGKRIWKAPARFSLAVRILLPACFRNKLATTDVHGQVNYDNVEAVGGCAGVERNSRADHGVCLDACD